MSLSTPPRGDTPASAFAGEEPSFPVTRPDYTGEEAARRSRKSARARERRNLAYGLTFLAPNIIGFLTFTAIPLVFSMVLAFSNWDLKLHNMFKPDANIEFAGLTNFSRLLQQADFWRFLGNTLFFMIGMPFSIAASLVAAILLSKDLRGGNGRVWAGLIAGGVLVACTVVLATMGMGGSAMLLLIGGVACGILIAGTLGGTTVYRTLFYVPHFTAGVATFLLWKKLYSPTGPVTAALKGPMDGLSGFVSNRSVTLWQVVAWVCVGLFVALLAWGLHKIRRQWEDGDIGWGGAVMAVVLVMIPAVMALGWFNVLNWSALIPVDPAPASAVAAATAAPQVDEYVARFLVDPAAYIEHVRTGLVRDRFEPQAIELTTQAIGVGRIIAMVALIASVLVGVWQLIRSLRADRMFTARPMMGVGGAMMLGGALMVALMVLLAFAGIFANLPAWSAHRGLEVPKWLTDLQWAKPAIMIMGFWGAIGSNTMLLYLAALTNVPQELYEAADIDGASRFQKFWNVTWPQLAPTTFFIVVMGVIGGLQGGFEMARVMTQGGPAGQTTTLAYFIYTEGFETGRLGYSSAVAWTLFLMVLVVTLFNWKFGNKYVND